MRNGLGNDVVIATIHDSEECKGIKKSYLAKDVHSPSCRIETVASKSI